MRFLVTGGAGFIGSHIVEALSKTGEVSVIDDLSSGKLGNVKPFLNKNVELHQVDVRSLSAIKPFFSDVDYVFHLAAVADVSSSVRDPAHCNDVNVNGTLNVLTASRDQGVKKLVYSSSSAVYGDAEKLPVDEDTALNPKSPYAVSKVAGEHYCRVFHELYGLETVSLRYFNVYGPRQNPGSGYGAVIPVFISRLLGGEMPMIYGDGAQTRDFTYVADVVRANTAAAESDAAGAYNIANGKPTSINTLFEIIRNKTGTCTDAVFEDERLGDIKHSYASTLRAKKELGWEPEHALGEGLEETIKWYRRNNLPRSGKSVSGCQGFKGCALAGAGVEGV